MKIIDGASWLVSGPGPVPEMLQFALGLLESGCQVELVQPFADGRIPKYLPDRLRARYSDFLSLRASGESELSGRLVINPRFTTSMLDVGEALSRRRGVAAWTKLQSLKLNMVARETVRSWEANPRPILVHSTLVPPLRKVRKTLPDSIYVYFGTAHPAAYFSGIKEERCQYPDFYSGALPSMLEVERTADSLLASNARIVVPSSYAAQSFVDAGWPPGRVVAVRLGVVPRDGAPIPSSNFDSSGREMRILFAGRIAPGKGIPTIFEVLKRDECASLTLVGSMDRGLRLPSHDRVTHVPWVDRPRLRAYFEQHDVFVLSSYSEGFGYSAVEAMTAGLPAVLSDRTIGRDLGSGPGFRLVEPGNASQLKHALQSLLAEGLEGRYAAQRVAEPFQRSAARRFSALKLQARER